LTPSSNAQNECDSTPDDCVRIQAKFLVLAMPQHSLELLEQGNFFFLDSNVQNLIGSVLKDPAIRLFMAYPYPWWIQKGVRCGRNTTDLPVRQFYYWHTAPPDAQNKESIVLASYANATAQKYWEGLQPRYSSADKFDNLPGGVTIEGRHDIPEANGPRGGTEEMGRLAHEQLKQVVGVEDAPEPYYAHYQDWVRDPWGAGWHAWTPGNNSDELIPEILQPMEGEEVYICGECYSNVQGWVQGALNTSEVLLQKKLGLSWPDWLSKGGTWLGPGSEGLG
jgi:monoamine oxidase